MKRLLVIHDADVVMSALAHALSQEGYDVISVAAPRDFAGSAAVDLVLVDVKLPQMRRPDGKQALLDLLGVEAPVYLFASGLEEELRARQRDSGADGYLSTEWGFRRLLQTVRQALGQALIPSGAPDSRYRVLVLDDDATTCNVVRSELERQGYEVQAARDVPAFERALGDFGPDVVLADVLLPGVEGDELCKTLKAQTDARRVPIVLMSSLHEDELARRAQLAGADAYFCKERGLDELKDVLNKLLAEIVF